MRKEYICTTTVDKLIEELDYLKLRFDRLLQYKFSYKVKLFDILDSNDYFIDNFYEIYDNNNNMVIAFKGDLM